LPVPGEKKSGKIESVHQEFLPPHQYRRGHSIVYSCEEQRTPEAGSCEFRIVLKKILLASRF